VASYTVLWPNRHSFFFLIQFQDLLGTKVDANATPFAPFPVDEVPEYFFFGHIHTLSEYCQCFVVQSSAPQQAGPPANLQYFLGQRRQKKFAVLTGIGGCIRPYMSSPPAR
jgi:hypothetical protein